MKCSPSQIWFNFLHSNYLIYNISWEDSSVDRELLKLNNRSKVLTITSAGCNALDYTLDNPALIDCVDVNPKQTALFELKLALIKKGNYQYFVDFFGKGKNLYFKEIHNEIKAFLSSDSQSFWNKKISYFDPAGNGLFYHGGTGLFAKYLKHVLKKKKVWDDVQKLVLLENKAERKQLFELISKKLWSGPEKHIWKTSWVLGLAGIPKNQREAIGDLNAFMEKILENIFVHQSAKHNPYWRVYLEGSYTPDYYPEYLKKEHFEALKEQVKTVTPYTRSLSSHLEESEQTYTHFVLLDHMDWLVAHNQQALHKQWELILGKSDEGAKVLFRTAYNNLDFIPEFVKKAISFEKVPSEALVEKDRVGTYSGTYLGTVQ